MPSSYTRRTILRGAATLPAAVAGCSTLDFGSNSLSVFVRNDDDYKHRISVSLFRRDRSDYEQARLKHWDHRLESSEQVSHENVVPARRYVVRVTINGDTHDHYHYYPSGCTDDAEDLFIRIHRPGYNGDTLAAGFKQNQC